MWLMRGRGGGGEVCLWGSARPPNNSVPRFGNITAWHLTPAKG